MADVGVEEATHATGAGKMAWLVFFGCLRVFSDIKPSEFCVVGLAHLENQRILLVIHGGTSPNVSSLGFGRLWKFLAASQLRLEVVESLGCFPLCQDQRQLSPRSPTWAEQLQTAWSLALGVPRAGHWQLSMDSVRVGGRGGKHGARATQWWRSRKITDVWPCPSPVVSPDLNPEVWTQLFIASAASYIWKFHPSLNPAPYPHRLGFDWKFISLADETPIDFLLRQSRRRQLFFSVRRGQGWGGGEEKLEGKIKSVSHLELLGSGLNAKQSLASRSDSVSEAHGQPDSRNGKASDRLA